MVRLKVIQSKMFHTSRCYCHCTLQNINSFCCWPRLVIFWLANLCEFFPECNQCFCEYLDIICTIFGQRFVQVTFLHKVRRRQPASPRRQGRD
uniref:Uncharacterized protein n=1 Tax=Meloidogyne incognita TaxID=6306 RepID=A0A914KN12_MELIC